MPTLHRISIAGIAGRLAAVLHLPDGRVPFPFLVAAHGLGSSKDSEKYVLIAERFSEAGIATCRFDFQGCGESGGVFADTTVAGEIEDLTAVVAAMRARADCDGCVALLGSSMGGFISLFVAHDDPGIRAIAAWACPADLVDLLRDPEVVRSYGLGDACLKEFESGRYRRPPSGAARCLFVHGDLDEVVPVAHARRLFGRAGEPRRLEVLAGADHRFSDSRHRSDAVQLSLGWIARFLRPGGVRGSL